MSRQLVLPVLLFCAGACGGESLVQPTTPTPDTPPILLTITPEISLLKVGASETFSAFAVFPDGSSRTVAPQWSIDQTAVAIVQDRGLVTAVGPGAAMLTASADGRTASLPLRVVPDYAGTWQGDVRIIQCADGDPGICTSTPCPTRGICPPAFPAGRILQILVILTHRDENVTGFMRAEAPVMPVKGAIDLTGTLALEGVLQERDSLGPYEYRLIDWKTTIDVATAAMRGTFVQVRPSFTNNRTTPPARIVYEIVSLRRTGPALERSS